MARQSSDKLLFEVQLVPPSASNIKTVSQAINKVSNAKQKNTKATQQSLKADQQQKAVYDKLKTDIRELETATKRAENANRFGNQTKEKSIKVTQAQLVQLEKLQKEIKQNNLSRKQEAKLMNLVATKRKTMNRSMGRVREGWRGLAKANRHGNRLLMQSGRILQDLPFGFMGISNNIQQLVTSFGRGSNSGKSFIQMLKNMGSSLMGTGGVIFLLGSALPFALQIATSGFIGFDSILGKSKKKTKEFKDELGKVVSGMKGLSDVVGEDPFGIRKAENSLSVIEKFRSELSDIRGLSRRISKLQKDQNKAVKGIQRPTRKLNKLEEERKELLDKAGMSLEEFNKLKNRELSLEQKIQKLRKQGKITEVGAMQIKMMDRIKGLIKASNSGITRMLKLTDDTSFKEMINPQKRLSEIRTEMTAEMTQLREKFAQADTLQEQRDIRQRINAIQSVVDTINDTIGEVPELQTADILSDGTVEEVTQNANELFNAVHKSMREKLDKKMDRMDEMGRLGDVDAMAERADNIIKFSEKLRDKRFEIREDMAGDLVQVTVSAQNEIREIRERAKELGIAGEKRVQDTITAIRRRAVIERTKLEEKREKQLRDAKFNMWSQTASFVQTVNSNILGNSKVVALIQLAIEKGLQIAKVASKTSEKVADLQQTAGLAGAKASMESAKAFSAMANGNVVKAGMHTTASGKFRQAQASATKQAGKTAGIGAKTIALIAGQTLAKGAGILSGGGSGGGSGGSGGASGGGGSRIGSAEPNEGFSEIDVGDRDSRIRGAVISAVKTLQKDRQSQPVFNFYGDLDNKAMSIRVEEGRQRRETNATSVKSDRV